MYLKKKGLEQAMLFTVDKELRWIASFYDHFMNHKLYKSWKCGTGKKNRTVKEVQFKSIS